MGNTFYYPFGQSQEDKKIPTSSEIKTSLMKIKATLMVEKSRIIDEMKRKNVEVTNLLKKNEPDIAKAKMPSILRDEDLINVNEIVIHLCDIVKEKVDTILYHGKCPEDLRAAVDTIIYATSRMKEELWEFKEYVSNLFGNEFVARINRNEDCLVNKNVIEKLQKRPFSDKYVVLRLREFARNKGIDVIIDEIKDPRWKDIDVSSGNNTKASTTTITTPEEDDMGFELLNIEDAEGCYETPGVPSATPSGS